MSNYIRRKDVERALNSGAPEELIGLLDGGDYDNGALERAQVTADNGNKVLVKLLLLLAAKGIVTKTELVDVLAD